MGTRKTADKAFDRKSYARPRLRVFGPIGTLTQSGSGVDVEAIMMGLRLHEGISDDLVEHLDINELVYSGLLERKDCGVRTTPKGRPLLNAILRDMLL